MQSESKLSAETEVHLLKTKLRTVQHELEMALKKLEAERQNHQRSMTDAQENQCEQKAEVNPNKIFSQEEWDRLVEAELRRGIEVMMPLFTTIKRMKTDASYLLKGMLKEYVS